MCDIVCENKTKHPHRCPMDNLDKLGVVPCDCCNECKKGCEANRDQILKEG